MKNEKLRTRQGNRSALKKRPPGKPEGAIARANTVANILGRAPAASLPARPVPAKWRWHYLVLLALQRRLVRERGELLRASAQPLEPHSMDAADSATDEFDHDLALTQLSAEQNALYEVNDALERILDGSYGVCEETGQAIPAARLRAIPWTRFTYAVEERLETKGTVPRPGLNKAASVRGPGQIRLASEEEADEDGEEPSALPNDETLSRVFSPPGPRVPLPKISKASPKASKPKGRKR
jgi:RNA polymerase-binding transcription factor DksA